MNMNSRMPGRTLEGTAAAEETSKVERERYLVWTGWAGWLSGDQRIGYIDLNGDWIDDDDGQTTTAWASLSRSLAATGKMSSCTHCVNK